MDVVNRRHTGEEVARDFGGVPEKIFSFVLAPETWVLRLEFLVEALDDVPHFVRGAGNLITFFGFEVGKSCPGAGEVGFEQVSRVLSPPFPGR